MEDPKANTPLNSIMKDSESNGMNKQIDVPVESVIFEPVSCEVVLDSIDPINVGPSTMEVKKESIEVKDRFDGVGTKRSVENQDCVGDKQSKRCKFVEVVVEKDEKGEPASEEEKAQSVEKLTSGMKSADGIEEEIASKGQVTSDKDQIIQNDVVEKEREKSLVAFDHTYNHSESSDSNGKFILSQATDESSTPKPVIDARVVVCNNNDSDSAELDVGTEDMNRQILAEYSERVMGDKFDEPDCLKMKKSVNHKSEDSNLSSETSENEPPTNSSSTHDINGKSSDCSEGGSSAPRLVRGVLKKHDQVKHKKSVVFTGVQVYYFPRSQGFTCVPSQGGSTLGMGSQHLVIKDFSLEGHAEEKKRSHRDIIVRQRKFAKMYQKQRGASTSESDDASDEEISDISDSELEMDSCYFLQPVPIRHRRALLRSSGVRKIDANEKDECRDIRASREFCGCDCRVYCDPATCQCSQAGIKCQVDRLSFPCGCTRDGCGNVNGRVEFNPLRVRTHFIHTLMRLEIERKQEQQRHQEALHGSSSGESSSDSSSNITPASYVISNNVYSMLSSSNEYSRPITRSVTNGSQFLHVQQSMIQPSGSLVSAPPHLSNAASSSQGNGHEVNGQDTVDMYGSPYSPGDSDSYSENSDYTSDEQDPEMSSAKLAASKSALQQAQENHKALLAQNALPSFPTLGHSSVSGSMYMHPFSSQTHFSNVQRPMSSSLNVQNGTTYLVPSQQYVYGEVYHNQYLPHTPNNINTATASPSSSSTVPPTTSNVSQEELEPLQHYTDLSQSIASKSIGNITDLLTAATGAKELIRAISPLSLESQNHVSDGRQGVSGDRQGGSSFVETHQVPEVVYCPTAANKGEKEEELSENLGEIIKKSMVETVSA
ncbi:Cysteine/serine-rich nuclear protein 2 [Halotydeus destructor]|nr:Cysteine/serine-rich nuclear protein 2 [Halotydeus destructor]